MNSKTLCLFALIVIIYTGCMVVYLQPEPKKSKLRSSQKNLDKLIILVSQPRSGSSYLGNLISNSMNSVYFYEPLYHVDSVMDINVNFATGDVREKYDDVTSEYLEHVLNCNLKRGDFERMFKSPFFKALSKLPQKSCDDVEQYASNEDSNAINRCQPLLSANHLGKKCRDMNLVVKLLELRIPYGRVAALEDLIAPSVNYEIIYLVRDPRAAFLSLLNTGWVVNSTNDHKFSEYTAMRCHEMAENVRQTNNKKHITITRYEDLMTKPKGELKTVYNFLKRKGGERILETLENSMCYVPTSKNKNTGRLKRRSLDGLENATQQHQTSISDAKNRHNITTQPVTTTRLHTTSVTPVNMATKHVITTTKNLEEERIAAEKIARQKSFNLEKNVFNDLYDNTKGKNADDEENDDDDGDVEDDEDDGNDKINNADSDEDHDHMQKVYKENYECYSINKWRLRVEQKFVRIVEAKCHDMMELLGYKLTNGDMTIIRDIKEPLVNHEYKMKRP